MPPTAAKANQKFFNHCSIGRAAEAAEMLRLGTDPEARDTYHLTGLIWAGRKGRIEVAEALLSFGANIDAVDLRKRTALSHAVAYKRRPFVKYLIERGAAVNPVDVHGWTPLDIALSDRDEQTAALLRSHGGVSGKGST